MHFRADKIRCESTIQYFQWYWTDYVGTLLERDNITEHVDSPRMLLHEIISEIQYNGFKNSQNTNLFQNQLREWIDKDKVLVSIAGVEIKLALGKYFKKQTRHILSEYCNKILSLLDEQNYTDKLIDHLVQYLENNTKLSNEERCNIRLYAQLIIAEFVSKGYDLNDIRDLAQDVPDVIQIQEGRVVSAPDSFFELSREQFASRKRYYDAVKERIGKRSVAEMLQPIRDQYHNEPIDAYLIIGLSYIKGVSDVYVDGVNIYSPQVKQYIKKNSLCELEKSTQNDKLCAAVPVKYIGTYTAIRDAKRKMDSVLELLSIMYSARNGIEYDLGQYYIVQDGRKIAEQVNFSERGMQNVEEFYKQVSAINVEELKNVQDDISTLFRQLQQIKHSSTEKRLRNALHWSRKANKAYTDEEKLIYCWFALEGLLKIDGDVLEDLDSKSIGAAERISSIAEAIIGPKIFRTKGFSVYYDMLWLVRKGFLKGLSTELKSRAGLSISPGQKYKTDDFISCAGELALAVTDEMLKDRFIEVDEFYTSIEKYKKEVKLLNDNILNIYRYRNLIVHNAVIPEYNMQYYSGLAYYICREVIRELLKRCTQSDITIEQALLRIVVEYDCFKENVHKKLNLKCNKSEQSTKSI